MVQSGLDRWVAENFAALRGHRVAVVCNQATVASDYRHILDHLLAASGFELVAAFGPQHGIWGHTQDNMIEWEGYRDPATGLPFYSLYGEHRKPTADMLRGIDLLLFDVPDVGARYYTFMWTLMLCMEACAELGVKVVVLDRPNPIGGHVAQGTVLEADCASFVGLRPLPMRHGLTMGELARHFHQVYYPNGELEVIELEGWRRNMIWSETGLPWVMPSPNMPTSETAMVYPGQCLLEGTNISEGRGTTRPFEMFGAPFLNGRHLCEALNALEMPGVWFRPITFQPTFHKFAGQICEGAFIHVVNHRDFDPTIATTALLAEIERQTPGKLRWNDPPYEYETEKLPIDILSGNAWLREEILGGTSWRTLRDRFQAEIEEFEPQRLAAQIYR